MAEKRNFISPNNDVALIKLSTGKLSFTKKEKNALKHLLIKLEINIDSEI